MRSLTLFAISLLASVPLRAAETPEWLTKISVHGFISQAYAVSEEHQIFGIPTGGTTDYRDLALQLRYDQDHRNSFVIQLRQQRRGESPAGSEDVELDWGFYQHDFSDRFSLKAGRIPLPLGIFNEAGGAAATYPFFRPPAEFYERQYTSKTLEGVLGTASFGDPGGWSFDIDGYAGQWALDRWGGGERVDAKEAYGAQLWVNTPISGVRVGGGAYRCTVEPRANADVDYLMLHSSVEANLDRWLLAAEYLSGNLDHYGRYRAWYGQVGFEVTPRISIHTRAAIARASVPSNGHFLRATISEDLGVAINYAIHPALMFKVEGHTNEGFLREDVPRNLYAAPSETRYFIASVVATF